MYYILVISIRLCFYLFIILNLHTHPRALTVYTAFLKLFISTFIIVGYYVMLVGFYAYRLSVLASVELTYYSKVYWLISWEACKFVDVLAWWLKFQLYHSES